MMSAGKPTCDVVDDVTNKMQEILHFNKYLEDGRKMFILDFLQKTENVKKKKMSLNERKTNLENTF